MRTQSIRPTRKVVKCNFTKNHPEIVAVLADLAKFSMDNQPTKLATKAGLSDETLRIRIRNK